MFIRRVGSAVVLIGVVIVAVWLHRGPFAFVSCGVAACLGAAGAREYYRMCGAKGMRPSSGYGAAAAGVYLVAVFASCYEPRLGARFELLAAFALVAGFFVLRASRREQGGACADAAAVLSGLVYVAWLWSFIFRILYFPGADGRWFLFTLFLAVKGGDMLAYGVGSRFGRHKLIPRISPGKTREGAAANLAGGLLAGLIAWAWFPCGFSLAAGLGMGALLSAVGQLGDLAESMLKRDAEVKDSSRSIPGMGGALDVLDSLLFALPVMYLYMEWFR